MQFFNEIWDFVPKENTYYNMKEAWTPEVILAINLKRAPFQQKDTFKTCSNYNHHWGA